ncbi:MAG: GNAT family N-acetyltransferase [Hylemonella sp.]|jgi:ribosomal protein S18 acetylase RimI-like enzyme
MASQCTPKISSPIGPEDFADLRQIFTEYASSLPIDLEFQGFSAELDALPGAYALPQGSLLMVNYDGQLAGCCALRPLPSVEYPNACEMKRLYVRPAFRRLGLGRLLAESIMDRARLAGYATILLDTLDDMEAARSLYQDLGFVEIPPFYLSPIAGAHYLKADL